MNQGQGQGKVYLQLKYKHCSYIDRLILIHFYFYIIWPML
uniref:Uncharacterized protein n=1 Tax=Pleurostomum flabellatum TaxID=405751 RepID=A0A7T0M4Q4_9EUKA|nr:hypothetical protein J6731_mgp42 [Pleurostomum flabellatum]QPL15644.1 hypothetical protein [Pleurostomum flabellatum]